MKNATLLCLLMICLSNSIIAQDSKTKDTSKYYSHYFFGLSYGQQKFPSLNNRISNYYPEAIPEKSFGVVGGGKTAWDLLALQGELGLYVGVNRTRNKGTTSLMMLNGSLDGGLMLTPGVIRVYPFAGLGLDVVGMSSRISNNNIHFDSLLANPVTRLTTEPVAFTSIFFTWRAGLAIDFGSRKYPGQPHIFGLRAGTRQSFHSSKWSFNGKYGFIGAPSDRFEQWFASVILYGETFFMDSKQKKIR